MLGRLLRVIVAFSFILLVCIGLIAGVLLVVSGDSPVDAVQTFIIGLRLDGRREDLQRPAGDDPSIRRFTVARGDSPPRIAANLQVAGLILDPALFVDYVRVNRIDTRLEAGTYFLNSTQTIPQIAEILTDSARSQIIFRVVEGWRMEQVAEAIDRIPLFTFSGADFLRTVDREALIPPEFAARVGLPNGASLEGFLFPNTYALPPDITPEALRDTLIEEFLLQIEEQTIPALAQTQGLTIFEVVTLASIIQRETVHPQESSAVGGVYMNRLRIGMRLDADPTVQYPLAAPGNWWPRITRADYQGVISPYNTYRNTGLPPGPIANPGMAAILGAVNPAVSDYLFFQAECNGSGYHVFARTYEEHLQNLCS